MRDLNLPNNNRQNRKLSHGYINQFQFLSSFSRWTYGEYKLLHWSLQESAVLQNGQGIRVLPRQLQKVSVFCLMDFLLINYVCIHNTNARYALCCAYPMYD